MASVTHGTVTVTLADHLAPPATAGKLSPDEVRQIPKPPRGIGLACDNAADAITKAGANFVLPPGVTAQGVQAAGERAEDIDQVIVDLEVVLNTLKQANVMFDADAWEMLRKLNDQVKAQGKHDPELLRIFKPMLEFFARGARTAAQRNQEK